jgi:hypothetical protein
MTILLPVLDCNLDTLAAKFSVLSMPHRHILSVDYHKWFLSLLDCCGACLVEVIKLCKDVFIILIFGKCITRSRLVSASEVFKTLDLDYASYKVFFVLRALLSITNLLTLLKVSPQR